jgi:hypothetical protein
MKLLTNTNRANTNLTKINLINTNLTGKKHPVKFFNYVYFLLSIFLSSAVIAQDDEMTKYLPSGCYHAGEYQQKKTITGVDIALNTIGTFVFNCDQGLIWHTQTPIHETLIYKIKGRHSIINSEGIIKNLDGRIHRELGKLLTNLIGGNKEYLTQHFSSAPIHTDNTKKDATSGIELTPKNKQMQKFLHSLQITPDTEAVNITLFLAEKETTQIRISDLKSFSEMTQSQCIAIATLPSLACDALFKGNK